MNELLTHLVTLVIGSGVTGGIVWQLVQGKLAIQKQRLEAQQATETLSAKVRVDDMSFIMNEYRVLIAELKKEREENLNEKLTLRAELSKWEHKFGGKNDS